MQWHFDESGHVGVKGAIRGWNLLVEFAKSNSLASATTAEVRLFF